MCISQICLEDARKTLPFHPTRSLVQQRDSWPERLVIANLEERFRKVEEKMLASERVVPSESSAFNTAVLRPETVCYFIGHVISRTSLTFNTSRGFKGTHAQSFPRKYFAGKFPNACLQRYSTYHEITSSTDLLHIAQPAQCTHQSLSTTKPNQWMDWKKQLYSDHTPPSHQNRRVSQHPFVIQVLDAMRNAVGNSWLRCDGVWSHHPDEEERTGETRQGFQNYDPLLMIGYKHISWHNAISPFNCITTKKVINYKRILDLWGKNPINFDLTTKIISPQEWWTSNGAWRVLRRALEGSSSECSASSLNFSLWGMSDGVFGGCHSKLSLILIMKNAPNAPSTTFPP